MRSPRSTYRLQVNAQFPLARIRELVEYFSDLGVSHLYLSPLLQARKGSTHGYDVIDHAHVNSEIGTDEELEQLSAELRACGMHLLLDIVPNHMAATEDNAWWRDVLRHGSDSRYASFFDIDWNADPPGPGRLLLPILGTSLEDCLDKNEIGVEIADKEPIITYFERKLPIAPKTRLLFDQAMSARQRGPALRPLLDAQVYALTYWVPGGRQINYRRFFDISELVGLCVERDEVFEHVHARVLDWLERDVIHGLRIDHIDGLRDPAGYLRRLDRAVREATNAMPYVVVEKILIGHEEMPAEWCTAGTTGYDMIGLLNGVFVEPEGWTRLRDKYAELTNKTDFRRLLIEKKNQIIRLLFPGETEKLGRRFALIAPELPTEECEAAVVELSSALSVYRTYVSAAGASVADHAYIEEAAALADARGAPRETLQALTCTLLEPATPEELELVVRWQQYTGPVMAKGLEDTAFYNYNPLISICEVGGYPGDPIIDLETFHGAMRERTTSHARTRALTATSTHDTKRSEDVRARIHVLSEIAEEWLENVERWLTAHAPPDQDDALMIYQTLIGAWPLDESEHAGFAERVQATVLKAVREAKCNTSWRGSDEEYEQEIATFASRVMRDEQSGFLNELREIERKTSWYGALNSLSQLVIKLAAPGVPDFYQGNELWTFSLVDPDNRRPIDYERRRRAAQSIGTDLTQLIANWRNGEIKLAITRAGLKLRNQLPEIFDTGGYGPISVTGVRARNVVAFARALRLERVICVAGRFFSELCEPEELPSLDRWGDTRIEVPAGSYTNALTGATVSLAENPHVGSVLPELPFTLLVRT